MTEYENILILNGMSLTVIYQNSTDLLPYPALANAFYRALEEKMSRLSADLRDQVTNWEQGSCVRFNRQGDRHELSLQQWIGEKGKLDVFSVVVRQNNKDTEPYLYNPAKRRSKWDQDKRRRPNLSSPVLG